MARKLVNESELVAAARSGDHDAFGALVTSYRQPTLQVASGIMRNKEDAEDVVQEALLKAYCNLNQFRGNSRFYTWLVRITINEALMKIRRRHGDRELILDDVNEIERSFSYRRVADWSICPERRYAQLELSEFVHNALAGLSPRLGAAFLLRSVEELSVKETAARLGLSVDGVKSRVSRARRRLRKRLHGVLRGTTRCPQKRVGVRQVSREILATHDVKLPVPNRSPHEHDPACIRTSPEALGSA